jgi:hypothetical protein
MKNFIIWAILLAAVGYGGSKLYLHSEVGDAMDMAVLMMAPYAKVEYDGVRSTLTGELTVEGVRVQVAGYSDRLLIDRIGIDTPSFFSLLALSDLTSKGPEAMPEYIGFLIEGMRVPVDADYFDDFYEFSRTMREAGEATSVAAECTGMYGFSPATLSALGYSDQVMSMTMALRDEKTQYSVEMDVSMQDMWDMDVDVAFDGNMMAEFARAMAYQPRLRDVHIEFTDRSLNERVSRHCQQQGLSEVETLKAQIDSFKFIGESNGIEFDQYMLDPYREFLLGKSTLVVTARPNNPVAFSQIDLYKASDVPALLNLAAVAR